MKLITWNVNGLRAASNKGFADSFKSLNGDIFCIQETKMQSKQAKQANIQFVGYRQYWNSADRKGYSGTLVFSKLKPLKVTYGLDVEEHDKEGRVITLEYSEFYLVNVYVPDSQRELKRLDYRMEWEDDFREYILGLDATKPVIICGDMNVAHNEIDLKNPKAYKNDAGFSDEEREKMTTLLDSGFVDTYRYLYPDRTDAYTWWPYKFNARQSNIGWRRDYFIVSERLIDYVDDTIIHSNLYGSDHCPVELKIEF